MATSKSDPERHEQEVLSQLLMMLRLAREAFTALWQEYAERLHARIRRNLPDDVRGVLDAEDVLQQAYAQAFRKVHTFQPQAPSSFYPWLAKIADNTLVDEVKKQRRLKRGGGRPAAGPIAGGMTSSAAQLLELVGFHEQTPSRVAARCEAADALHVALAGLKESQRQALELVHLKGLSREEAAQAMGISKAALGSLLDRGLKSLREALGSMSNYLSR